MNALRRHPLLALSLGLFGCNAVFGLDEGHLSGGSGESGASASDASSASNESSSSPSSTASSASGSGSPSSSGSGGAGGGCLLEEGLVNANFELQEDGGGPQNWPKTTYNTSINLSTAEGLTTGISMVFVDIGANAYGGVRQEKNFIGWDGCVRLSGDSRRRSGSSGQLRAHVVMGDAGIELDLPMGSDYASFERTCSLPAPIDSFTVSLLVDELLQSASATIEMHQVALDRVCCSGSEPVCSPHP